ncbi:hypothetical protein, partial [Mycolicibacterium insubricum]|uniref:hypothetical protein n=1 Tax=Mycolicibacterium insubricum TaxID=444597 RepID=UPI0021F3906D
MARDPRPPGESLLSGYFLWRVCLVSVLMAGGALTMFLLELRAELFPPARGGHRRRRLLADGWEVWLENWRASIDVPRNRWNLDQAAAYDHPQAVRTIC